VIYRCYPGAADGHWGQTCINHPPQCDLGQSVIAVDPVRGDPYCSLENERANLAAGGRQIDPNGDCPP